MELRRAGMGDRLHHPRLMLPRIFPWSSRGIRYGTILTKSLIRKTFAFSITAG